MNSADRLVQWLGSDEPAAELIAHLRCRGLVLDFKNSERGDVPRRLTSLVPGCDAGTEVSLVGRRVAILNPDPAGADALAQTLRNEGGDVLVLSLDPATLDRVETFDPDAVLVEPADFSGGCWEMVRALWEHPRLRWAPLVLTPSEPVGLGVLSAPNSRQLCHTIRTLGASYDALIREVSARARLDTSLATLGPVRTLRALLAPGIALRALFTCGEHRIELDIAEDIIVGAQELGVTDPLLGPDALAHVLSADAATVAIKRVVSPAVTNVMSPLNDALHSAGRPSRAPILSKGVSGISRKKFSLPANDCAPTVRPPSRAPQPAPLPLPSPGSGLQAASARLYVLPPGRDADPANTFASPQAATPRGPTPVKRALPPPPPTGVGPTQLAPPSIPLRARPDRGAWVASAAALNLESEWDAIEALPTSEEEDESLDLPIDEPAERESAEWEPAERESAEWEPAELNGLLGEDHQALAAPLTYPHRTERLMGAARVRLAAALVPLTTFGSQVATATRSLPGFRALRIEERLSVAGAWFSQHWRSHRRLMVLAPIAVLSLVAAGIVYGRAEVETQRAAAEAAVPTLRFSFRKLESQPAAAPADVPVPAEVDEVAPVSRARRASQLVSEGHALRKANELDKADSRYRKALRAFPGYPRAFSGLARSAMQRGDGAKAVKHARAFVRSRPRQAGSYLVLGDAHLMAGNRAFALAAWRKAAKLGSRAARRRLK